MKRNLKTKVTIADNQIDFVELNKICKKYCKNKKVIPKFVKEILMWRIYHPIYVFGEVINKK